MNWKRSLKILATGIFLSLPWIGAQAQQVNMYWQTGTGPSGWKPVTATDPLPVNATVNASIAGFHPESSLTPITATTLGVSSSAFTAGKSVLVQNVGATNAAYCFPGAAATTSSEYVPAGGSALITTTVETVITCATSTSTTTINFQVGTGLWTGAGAGGAGAGGGTSSSFSAAFPATGTAIGLTDGTNMQAWMTALIQPKTSVNGNNMGSVASWVYNGASFDALIGTAANGAYVQSKSGAFVDGAIATMGAEADAACGTATGTCTMQALLKYLNSQVVAATPAGTNTIGNVGADPSSGKATPTETFLALPATTTTQIIALSGSTKIYVTHALVLAGGTVNVTFKYGTGVNCGTGTTTLEGPWPLTAQAGYSSGNGSGPVMIVPAGQALCITTDASVSGGVKLISQQF